MNNNLSSHNQTIPTTIGALLTEECTIDPLSHLPSFLELTFVDVARNSGRKALSAAWGVGIAWLEDVLERLRRLERRLSGRMSSRLTNDDGGRSSSSLLLRLLRAIRTLTTQLARVRVRLLRRLCHFFLGAVKTLGPEIQALIMYAIDYNCMQYLAGATACEMVYGLKRSKIVKARHPLSKKPVNSPQSLHAKTSQTMERLQLMAQKATDDQNLHRVAELTRFDKTCSALLAALLPYWKERCDQCYSEWKEQSNSSNSSSVYHTPNNISTYNRSTVESSKEKFLMVYPYAHLVHEGSIFLYQFAYLMGCTPYWSFSLHALGVMLRRMTVADVKQQQKQQHQLQSHQKGGALPSPNSTHTPPLRPRPNTTSSNSPLQTKLTIPQLLRGAVLLSVSYTLLSGWYSHFQRQLRLRRRRWIAGDEDESTSQSQEGETNDGQRRRSQLPIPSPPMPPNLLDEHDQSIDKWSCPICKEPRINPTASTSGFVFCYKCLVSHLRQNGNFCPVTAMPCWENKVVRLYEPTASRRGTAGGANNSTNR
ncbi:hypothetical protein ACHAXR_008203 [Thalassiosira sp. AJA248-18]